MSVCAVLCPSLLNYLCSRHDFVESVSRTLKSRDLVKSQGVSSRGTKGKRSPCVKEGQVCVSVCVYKPVLRVRTKDR